MPENARSAQSSGPPILARAEVERRMLLLAELQGALAALGVRSVLARNHRLVLQYDRSPCEPSGMTDPQLHILGPTGTDIATTDCTTYRLASGQEYPAAGAALMRHGQHVVPPNLTPAAPLQRGLLIGVEREHLNRDLRQHGWTS